MHFEHCGEAGTIAIPVQRLQRVIEFFAVEPAGATGDRAIVSCAHAIVGQKGLAAMPLGAVVSAIPWFARTSSLTDGTAALLTGPGTLRLLAAEPHQFRRREDQPGISATEAGR